MQLELELRWYTDQLGKLEDLASQEITDHEWVWLHSCIEWAFNHTHFAFRLEIKLTRLKLLLDSSV